MLEHLATIIMNMVLMVIMLVVCNSHGVMVIMMVVVMVIKIVISVILLVVMVVTVVMPLLLKIDMLSSLPLRSFR